LVPTQTQIVDYQRDLVDVVSSSDDYFQHLAEDELLVPYFEVRRRLTDRHEPVRLRFRHNGRVVEVSGQGEDLTSAIPPVPWLAGKLLRFRAVDKTGPMRCRW
jgi:hypothetical protein